MSKNVPPAQVPIADIGKFDVIRVTLKNVPDRVTAVILAREFNVRRQIISFDAFPVDLLPKTDTVDRSNAFSIYSEGYKEQMGLSSDEDFKISFAPATLLVGNVDTVEKIGYVGMRNAKEIIENEFYKRAGYNEDDQPACHPAFTVKPDVLKVENPTLNQLAKRGELSEYTRWVFSGENEGSKVGPILNKKGQPVLDKDGNPILLKTLKDLYSFISQTDEAQIAKTVRNVGPKIAAEVVNEVQNAIKFYPQ